jgi:hypothetical protein
MNDSAHPYTHRQRVAGDGAIPAALELLENKVSTTGVVMTRYHRAGAVKTGSFAPDQPGPAEIGRREKMKREG